jgi:hypothetical protein
VLPPWHEPLPTREAAETGQDALLLLLLLLLLLQEMTAHCLPPLLLQRLVLGLLVLPVLLVRCCQHHS